MTGGSWSSTSAYGVRDLDRGADEGRPAIPLATARSRLPSDKSAGVTPIACHKATRCGPHIGELADVAAQGHQRAMSGLLGGPRINRATTFHLLTSSSWQGEEPAGLDGAGQNGL